MHAAALLVFAAGLGLVVYLRDRLRRHRRRSHDWQRDVWSIGVYEGSTPWTLGPATGVVNPVLTAGDVTDLPARFVADPFMVESDGRRHLFFEVMPRDSRHGVIAHAHSQDGLRWQYDAIVLREPFHLSYPYVFAHDGGVYMVPECAQSGSVRLYRAESFPGGWRHVATLLTSQQKRPPLLEPSIVYHDGRWFLFTYARRVAGLHLFWSDTLTGRWVEHPRSPVLTRSPHFARPAGRVVRHGADLYRFAQDGRPRYGSRVWAFRIVELNATAYREERVPGGPVVEPGAARWHRSGMHTVDAHRRSDGSWIALVDGLDDAGPDGSSGVTGASNG